MTDQELRVLVREAIAQQLGRRGIEVADARRHADAGDAGIGGGRSAASFDRFGISSGPDGTCIIEPSVMCNHCGYCKSYGH